ncbi:energy transducer TonB [Hymenobacter sp. HSC-4F20]|uniref:energy transducer TonB n=1 Tax=Hymenobacter sp. HSC-4F20 TaxID=2864135 RepID=UPI001C72C900|nr:energy transducer TonB [Hymenobacter sp. HSC-4F20]MBX0289601.1 energy transducer TonB [Hymenobacter sp. HSC-4F20]
MFTYFSRTLALVGLLLSTSILQCFLLTATGQSLPPSKVQEPVYRYVEEMPRLPYIGASTEALQNAVQQRLVFPRGTMLPADKRVFVDFTVEKDGKVTQLKILKSADPSLDAVVLNAVRQLPTFIPGKQNAQPVRVTLTLPLTLVMNPWDPTMDATALRTEAQTCQSGIARRQPGEADTTFLQRVLPVSFYLGRKPIIYAWRSSAFGKQLVFSANGYGDNAINLFLFVLDPYQNDTYAVHSFNMESMGDLTTEEAIFFADVDQDGQKELLVLNECSLKETLQDDDGNELHGRVAHYETRVFQYQGLSNAGRPQYREDPTPRDYLNELPTAAAVRQALVRHQRPKPPQQKPANKNLK